MRGCLDVWVLGMICICVCECLNVCVKMVLPCRNEHSGVCTAVHVNVLYVGRLLVRYSVI